MKKVFFGGSFDPPHRGHLGIARAAVDSGKCSHVVWFPAYLPPHKRTAERAPFEHRINMVELMIKEQPDMSVSDFEAKIAISPSYTIDILHALYKDTGEKYAVLIGGDSLLNLHLWHKAENIVREFEFITYPRAGYDISMEKLLNFWDHDTAAKLMKGVIPGTFFEISSSEIKKTMEKSTLKRHIIQDDGFTPEIDEYIRRNHLYETCTDDKKGTL